MRKVTICWWWLFSILPCTLSASANELLPTELQRFVEPDTTAIDWYAADFYGNHRKDVLLVLEKDEDEGSNPIVLLLNRQSDGSLVIKERTQSLLACRLCVGTHGGSGIEKVGKGWFSAANTIGDASFAQTTQCVFRYSKREAIWKLAAVVTHSYSRETGNSSQTENLGLHGPLLTGDISRCGG